MRDPLEGLSESGTIRTGADIRRVAAALRPLARKSLLAVAGLVSVHDHTWTTYRETSADRWSSIAPEHDSGLAQSMSWTSIAPEPPVETVRDVLHGTVEAIVSAFDELIGLWPKSSGSPRCADTTQTEQLWGYGDAMELTAEEVRVLGCLIEKQATTPEHYPLSTNALVTACNQKSNREPATDYSERTVMDAMLLVRQKGLARMNSSGRTDKHRHILDDALGLDRDQLALLAVMMLRGPQSAGELKTRTERYSTSQGTGFGSVDDIDAVLAQLAEGVDPFAANIGRASGQSQDRWAHLFGEVVPDVNDAARGRVTQPASLGPSLAQRVGDMEARLAVLESALGRIGALEQVDPPLTPRL